MMPEQIVFIIIAYLFGSLPVLYWIGKSKGFDLNPREEDLHQVLWRKVGYAEGFAGGAWDVLKGPIPPLMAWLLDFDLWVVGLAGLAVTAGQMWPIFTGFKGKERGNTTGMGSILGISPAALGVAIIPIAIGGGLRIFRSTRKAAKENSADGLKFPGVSDSMPLGMLIAFLTLPVTSWALDQDPEIIWSLAGMTLMIILRRLTADLGEDLQKSPRPSTFSILGNRFLYDRPYR